MSQLSLNWLGGFLTLWTVSGLGLRLWYGEGMKCRNRYQATDAWRPYFLDSLGGFLPPMNGIWLRARTIIQWRYEIQKRALSYRSSCPSTWWTWASVFRSLSRIYLRSLCKHQSQAEIWSCQATIASYIIHDSTGRLTRLEIQYQSTASDRLTLAIYSQKLACFQTAEKYLDKLSSLQASSPFFEKASGE